MHWTVIIYVDAQLPTCGETVELAVELACNFSGWEITGVAYTSSSILYRFFHTSTMGFFKETLGDQLDSEAWDFIEQQISWAEEGEG